MAYQKLSDLITTIKRGLLEGKQLKNLSNHLLEYDGDDWKKYKKYCCKSYTRNRVYCDDEIEVLILCWNCHQQSGIHDHPENGCLLRLLKGDLIEIIYRFDGDKPTIEKTNQLNGDIVSYQEGKYGLHNITNPNEKKAVSLHIYSPPNYKTNFFDPKNDAY